MKKSQKRVGFIVLVVILAGTMTTLIDVHGATSFYGNVKDDFDDPVIGASIILADCYFTILDYDTTDGSGDYSFSVTLNGNSPYFLSAGKEGYDSDTKVVTSGEYNFELEIAEKIAVFFW
ncbi:MAG: carboxypeptidase regulatory-like domain-containing protein, partial [Candidatus Heimdallarchaeota archaeon]|nr:carboxypeptidase regulatory-like domain-containing protein [Candidatus Heimdallarchaeota archaeon]